MKNRIKLLSIGILVLLVVFLVACEGEPDSSAVPPTSTVAVEITETAEMPPLSPIDTPTTYLSVSQFPVAIIEFANAQRPAYAVVEMVGFNIVELFWQIGQYGADCNRLVAMDLVSPGDVEAGAEFWRDGVHQYGFSWSAAGHFLSDGSQGDFVLVQGTESGEVISGRFRSAVSGEVFGANLLVEPEGTEIVGLQRLDGEGLTAVAGDSFQLFSQCLEADGSVRSEPGTELVFLEGGQLVLEKQPVPSGDYFLHLNASSPQNSASSTTDFPVDNDAVVADYQVYLESTYGFQFLYPTGWQTPQSENDRIVTGDNGGATSLTITTDTDLGGKTPSDLKNQTLDQFGNVPVLFEDQIPIGDTGALWTAYGYTSEDGPHTGILLTFIRDNVGYVVDIDGLETAEDQTITLMNDLAANWLFRPDIAAPRAMEWTEITFDDLTMPIKANYYQEMLDNGWRRFTVGDGVSFMAVRTESLERDDLADRLAHWQEVVQRGVTDISMSEAYAFTLGQREWSKVDFAYSGTDGSLVEGFLIASEINGRAVTFWIEVPEARYGEQSADFLLSLAGLSQ